MVDKIYGNKGFASLNQTQRTDKAAGTKKADNVKTGDRVDFSSALQHAENVQTISSTQETARMEKLAAIKSQIQNGTYQPDLNKVASSLLPFLMRES